VTGFSLQNIYENGIKSVKNKAITKKIQGTRRENYMYLIMRVKEQFSYKFGVMGLCE
jgi:hypothetical protein